MFVLSVERSAEKELKKLPSIYFPKVIAKIQELSNAAMQIIFMTFWNMLKGATHMHTEFIS